MKKVYSIFLMLTVSAFAIGQNSSIQNDQFKSTTSTRTNASNNVQRTNRAAALWSNTFDTPSDWVIGNEVGNSDDWVIGTAGPAGPFAISPISSTSGGNFAMFDSDNLCSGNQVANLTTANPIDLSSSSSTILEFEQYYERYNDLNKVLVSVDGINWTEFVANPSYSNNDISTNPAVVQLNISAVAGGQATVWIRFQFYSPSSYNAGVGSGPGCGYAWMIDDVAIVEGPDNDIVLDKVFHNNVITAWEYEITPLDQVVSKELGVVVRNNAATPQSNVMCAYDIMLNSGSVNSGSFLIADTLQVGEIDTVWYDTQFTPSQVGEYTVSCEVTADSVDMNSANNTVLRGFDISEFEWSHEREALWDDQYGGYIVSGSSPEEMEIYSQGVLFTPVVSADLYALKVSFGTLTTTPMSVTVEIHEVGSSIQDIVSSDYQGGDVTASGWQTFVLENPIAMAAGTTYIVAIGTEGGTDVMTINGWGVDDDFGAANYGPFGTGGAVNWYNGWNYSSAIRAVFDPSVGIKENEDVSGLSVYPNPTSDLINVAFVSKDNQNITVNVFNVTGALVQTEQRTVKVGQRNLITFDTEKLSSGMYMVQLVGANATVTEQVVVR